MNYKIHSYSEWVRQIRQRHLDTQELRKPTQELRKPVSFAEFEAATGGLFKISRPDSNKKPK